VGELTHYLDNVTAIVELGAGKGLLGRVLQDVSAISRGDRGALPLVAIEQRECPTYDSREHDVTRLNGTSVAQGFVLDDKIPHGALVIAKHFCGNASDEAVRLILASERVALAALAPCCHPAMQWDAFCAREAKGPLGALLTEAHFPVLLDLIALSRHGRGGSSGRDCKRWESLQALGADSCYRAGRAARVVLEAARLQQLAAAGFSTALVEYVGSGTAPDNLILLAARPSSSLERGLGPLIQTPRPSGLHLPPCGVVLHTAAKGASQTERLAEYLQELRERGERAIESVEMHTLELAPSAGGGASILAPCVVAGGEAEAVLKALMASEVLCRSIDQITPYDRSACVAHSRPSAEADAAAVVTALPRDSLAGRGQVLRMNCLPRSLEWWVAGELHRAGAAVSPSAFSHTLFVLAWRPRGSGDAERLLLTGGPYSRDLIDLRAWREKVSAAAGLPHSRIAAHVQEVAERHPRCDPRGKRIGVVATSKGSAEGRAYEAVLSALHATVDVIPERTAEESGAAPAKHAYDMLIVAIDRGDVPAVAATHRELLKPDGVLCARAKLGAQARGRRITEQLLASWRKHAFPTPTVRHLLADKETDRTIIVEL